MASTRQRGSKFMALYRDADGKQRSAGSFPTKAQALRAGKLAEQTGSAAPAAKTAWPAVAKSGTGRGQITVHAYATQWLAGHRASPAIRKAYDWVARTYLLPRFGTTALRAVTAKDVRVWFRQLEARGQLQAAAGPAD